MKSNYTQALRQHFEQKPLRPVKRYARLVDATPESIAFHLGKVSPTAALMSNEGGLILDGRAMGNIPFFNDAWGGGVHKVNRRSTESFSVENGRLTVAAMFQQSIFDTFRTGRGSGARGNGFLSGGLHCWPRSTQGLRPLLSIEEAKLPKLKHHNQRIAEILKNNTMLKANRDLERKVLEFSPDAKMLWKEYANHTEDNMNPGGLYFEARDAASRSAENAARVAALFHLYEGREGLIQRDMVEQACKVCAWYLEQFVQIYCPPPPLPQEQTDAMLLHTWLRDFHGRTGHHMIQQNYIRKYGPNKLRNKMRLEAAIAVLDMAMCTRVCQAMETKHWFVELNLQSAPYVVY